MAGTMPHAVFVELDWDGQGGVAAYAAELPGCAAWGRSDAEAVNELPRRVERFSSWLRGAGESAPNLAGGVWYEVERASATGADGERRRAGFSLDELPPTDEEFGRYLRWLELAREELADALDASDYEAAADELAAIERQDLAFARELGGRPPPAQNSLDGLYAARDALTDALEAAGPTADGVRRAVRIAIADDLRAAERLRASEDSA
jgi:hypothetical protein